MYEKGIQTRNHIYNIAKQLFYDLGYTKTRIQQITETADVPMGLFSYYFKTKDKIAEQIYSEFNVNINQRITETFQKGFENSIIRNAVHAWIYYDKLLNNPNNRRFHREIMTTKSNYRGFRHYYHDFYIRYANDFNLYISDEDLDTLVLMEYGARREYFLHYFKHNLSTTIDEIVFLINGTMPRLLGIEQNTVSTLLHKGIALAKTVPSDDLTLLV